MLCAAVGADDFAGYAEVLEKVGVDTTTALWCKGVPTGAAFITTDLEDNQITAFHAGAMGRADGVDITRLRDVSDVVVGANAAPAMARHVRDAAAMRARLTFVPAQQIPAMPDEDLRAGVAAAWCIVGNDYEVEMIRQRTGMVLDEVRTRALVATPPAATTGT